MARPGRADSENFGDLLHVALELQLRACALARVGDPAGAARAERRALLLLHATRAVDEGDPVLGTVRALAGAGIARLRRLPG